MSDSEVSELRFGMINRVILFGGAPIMVRLAEQLRTRDLDVHVFTSPRQAGERMDADGRCLADCLFALGQHFVVTEDIGLEPSLPDLITSTTLGLGLGEAWSFPEAIIEQFGGRLLDFMGIPHPRYRGGAHYTWMILRGDRRMGMNLQVVNEEMVQGERDTGAIVSSACYDLPSHVRIPSDYFAEAAEHEAGFLLQFIDEARSDKAFVPQPPDEERSLFLPRLHTATHGWIDWSWSGRDIERFVCAFDDPYPGARTHLDGVETVLRGARLIADEEAFHPFQSGLITRVTPAQGAVIATPDGHLAVRTVLQGGRDVVASLSPGQRFVTPAILLEQARSARARYSAHGLEGRTAGVRPIEFTERFDGERTLLRLVTLADCTERYVGWLEDPEVNRFLETRFQPQTLETVASFVRSMIEDPCSHLFAIVDNADGVHVGNLKIGPVNRHHSYADVSYFVGERDRWGRGLATDAIRTAIRVGFERLGLHRLQAGVYEGNLGSCRALERAGFALEGRFRKQLRCGDGVWQDHLWYGLVRES